MHGGFGREGGRNTISRAKITRRTDINSQHCLMVGEYIRREKKIKKNHIPVDFSGATSNLVEKVRMDWG